MNQAWDQFIEGFWQKDIDVEDFISRNFSYYDGDDSFLAPITDNTKAVWERCEELLKEERKLGVLDIEMDAVSGINNFKPGYILKEKESIVGLQADAPLKRIINPYGGIKLASKILEVYGRKMKPEFETIFNRYTKTHNQGVFDAYTPEIKKARHTGLLTGLPDAYGRGRIIGDYRRVALYGIDFLIEAKKADLNSITDINDSTIQLREEVSDQIKALKEIKAMAASYGHDISGPAKNAQEAVQWLYYAYLAAVKENNGAAMSLGRTSTFLDIYIERDLKELVKVRDLVAFRRFLSAAAGRAGQLVNFTDLGRSCGASPKHQICFLYGPSRFHISPPKRKRASKRGLHAREQCEHQGRMA